MPAGIIIQVLVEGICEAVVQGAVLGNTHLKEQKRERVLAAADLLVLAAHHDSHVSPAEREELTARCVEVLGNSDVVIDVPALLVRWEDERAALDSDQMFEAKVRQLAEPLSSKDKEKVLIAVEAVLTASSSPDAGGSALQGDALEVFRRTLG